MITISPRAQEKITDLLAEESKPGLSLRVFIQGGGCSGFSYGFTFDEEKNDDDWDVSVGPYTVLIDSMSATYLDGAEIDYKEELMGSSFTINNPNAKHTCGCGSSFGV